MNKLKLERRHGVFIAVEGGDGSGKTTVVEHIHRYLSNEMNYATVLTKEPGGTEFAMKVRELLFMHETKRVSHTAQALLVAAARHDHATQVIAPAIDDGRIVLCDRYTLSTRMYQRHAENLEQILDLGSKRIQPTMTLILDVDPDVASKRLKRRAEEGGQANWLDNLDYNDRMEMRTVYLTYARNNPMTTHVIDTNQPLDRVIGEVHKWVTANVLPLVTSRLDPFTGR